MENNSIIESQGIDLQLIKYPRTSHIQGSRIQDGDEDLEAVPCSTLFDKNVVIEEKVDGSNTGISFTPDLNLRLQSRGHFLTGGPRERRFDIFKRWANIHQFEIMDRIYNEYIVYGEWMYCKHTVFYDRLPHYFMEFDVLDKRRSTPDNLVFLDTISRHNLLQGLPFAPVRVLFHGKILGLEHLKEMIVDSYFMSHNGTRMEILKQLAEKRNLNAQQVLVEETDSSEQMEGLYIKVEANGIVQERYKLVRTDFVSKLKDSDTHWMDRPIIPNQLSSNIDIFAMQGQDLSTIYNHASLYGSIGH